MRGMQEADHHAGAQTTVMLTRLGMNPWQECLRESVEASQNTVCLFVCLLAKISEQPSSDD